jgi:hypothetical protein
LTLTDGPVNVPSLTDDVTTAVVCVAAGTAPCVAVALCVALGWDVAVVDFFVATGFALFVAVDDAVDDALAGDDDEADADEPVPVVPITEPPAMFIELLVDN